MRRRKVFVRSAAVGLVVGLCAPWSIEAQAAPIQVGFLWHMHQPIYRPYMTPAQVDASGLFSFSVTDVHNGRLGPYTTWPGDAVSAGLGMAHLGAQVSFSGSLAENLHALEAAGVNGGMWNNWDGAYRSDMTLTTSLGNRRLELVAFGYHHPLMPLLNEREIRMQIQLHKAQYARDWQQAYSRGMFPAETAFSTRIIPALASEGVEWVLVDNIHFDRACQGYPHDNAASMFAPNSADQINTDPTATGGAWVQLNNLWAPTRVSAPFGYRPHLAQHIDPDTGAATRMTVVPAARYEGNEDGRGGFGAFLYDQVMDAYLPYNTDPAHPIFVVLHHDGDNFGGGSDAYYHTNFQNMVAWASSDPDYDVTTINDYLERFPVDPADVVHVESGSWAGADGGDPEFKKWLGDPGAGGVSPDIHSWAVLTAARNHVLAADANAGPPNLNNILNGVGTTIDNAWRYLLVSQASDYWYWDGTEVWDENVTAGANQSVAFASSVLGSLATETTPPSVFVPQREPYNPGAFEWDLAQRMPSEFEVWTLAYDAAGLSSVTLKWRIDADGSNPIGTVENETYSGGPGVGVWQSIAMSPSVVPTPSYVMTPTYKAQRWGATIVGQTGVLVDYYVEATDLNGNVERSDIQHVWVGDATTGGGDGGVTISPDPAVAGQSATISYDPAGGVLAGAAQVYAHIGFNAWNPVLSPDPAMTSNTGVWEHTLSLPASATQLDVVFNNGAGIWDNNNGQDWHFAVSGGTPTEQFVIDGALDAGAAEIATSQSGATHLWVGFDGVGTLYLATEDPGASGLDRFLVLASAPGGLSPAMWDKSGSIAGWDAFLGAEADNDFSGWFDNGGFAESATGSVLEGTIDLVDEFGSLPNEVYIAVGAYATPNAGTLSSAEQAPATTNGDGDLDASEFTLVRLCEFDASCCAPDLTTTNTNPGDAGYGSPDGVVNGADLSFYIESWLAAQSGCVLCEAIADVTTSNTNPGDPGFGVPDNAVNGADLSYYVELWLAGCF